MTTRVYLQLKLESETGGGLLQLTSSKVISDIDGGRYRNAEYSVCIEPKATCSAPLPPPFIVT